MYGGGSGTVSIALQGGERIARLQVVPSGPLESTQGTRGDTNFLLAVKRSGRTTVTASDLAGKTYTRTVSVNC